MFKKSNAQSIPKETKPGPSSLSFYSFFFSLWLGDGKLLLCLETTNYNFMVWSHLYDFSSNYVCLRESYCPVYVEPQAWKPREMFTKD